MTTACAAASGMIALAMGSIVFSFEPFRSTHFDRCSRPITRSPPWQGMQYRRDMFSGAGKLHPLDNERYRDVRFTRVRACT